jgi:hypothetical protein
MREQLAQIIRERVGLDEATALQAADTALEFIKSKLPPEIASILEGGEANAGAAGGLLGGLLGQRSS